MDRNRLYWASRRGMLELDLILMPFLEHHFDALSAEDKQDYVALLDCEDQDLFAWFLSRSEPDNDKLKRIVAIIREKNGVS